MNASYRVVIRHIAVTILLLGGISGLVGCGGGGSDGPGPTTEPTATPTPGPDTTPHDFDFTLPQSTYAPGAVATTDPVIITEINTLTDVSITSGGAYAIDGGSFTSEPGQIANNQTLVARATAGANFGDEITIKVTVGTVKKTFVVYTDSQDTLPDDFAPAAPQTGVLRGTDFTFPEFTVAGITGDVDVSITGGLYAKNNGDFVSTTGSVTAGDTVAVRVTASTEFSTSTSATLTIGTGEGVFTVISEAEDVNPDPFELGDNTTASATGQTADSNIITIAGINSPANISILNGQYRIEGVQDWSNDSSTVGPGKQVQVRVTSGSQLNMTESAVLTIGDQSDSFGITLTDQNPPSTDVIFPTANTMSDGSFVTLRGKASDDFGPVTQIQAIVTTDNGTVEVDNETITATAEDNFINTWSVRVDLASEKLNTIQVIATDAGGNIQETPVTLTILQKADALTTNFPEGNDEHIGEFPYRGLAFDKATGRLYIPTYGDDAKILEVDTRTGFRSEFLPHNSSVYGFAFLRFFSEENALFFGDQGFGNAVYRVEMDTKVVSVVSDDTNLESDTDIYAPMGMRFGTDGLLYVLDVYEDTFFKVNTETGSRTLISGITRPLGGGNAFDAPTDLWIDEANNRALVSDQNTSQLLWVNLNSGERTVFVDSTELTAPFEMEPDLDDNRIVFVDVLAQSLLSVQPDTGAVTTVSSVAIPEGGANSLQYPFGLAVDDENNIAFVVSNPDEGFSSTTGVLLIDVENGERIILTNSVQ